MKANSFWNNSLCNATKDGKNSVHYLENLTFWPCYLAFQYNKSLKIL